MKLNEGFFSFSEWKNKLPTNDFLYFSSFDILFGFLFLLTCLRSIVVLIYINELRLIYYNGIETFVSLCAFLQRCSVHSSELERTLLARVFSQQ
jgi:hypothetical protein